MILQEVALLASDTTRTKAYLQAMVKAEMLPGTLVIYSDEISKMKEEAVNYEEGTEKEYFDTDEPIVYTAKKWGIECTFINNKDINSDQMKEAICQIKAKYLIYSGYGGYILKPHLFQLGKKYIHVHAGILPQYRGSTTVYYSMLQEGRIGATAIFLNEKIDEGEIIEQKEFALPGGGTNIDYIYEPYVRSRVLLSALEQLVHEKELSSTEQSKDGAEIYYIIHPVLKHLALLKIESE